MVVVKVVKVGNEQTDILLKNGHMELKSNVSIGVNRVRLEHLFYVIITTNTMLLFFIAGVITYNVIKGSVVTDEVIILLVVAIKSVVETILFYSIKYKEHKEDVYLVKKFLGYKITSDPKWFVMQVMQPLYGSSVRRHVNTQTTDKYVYSVFKLRQVDIQ
jgi:hypothetical protein